MLSVRALFFTTSIFFLALTYSFLASPAIAQTPATNSAAPRVATNSARTASVSAEPEIAGTDISLGIGNIMQILDKDVKDGHIISASDEGPTLSKIYYDSQVLGVVDHEAAIVLNTGNNQNGVPVVSTGNSYVLVSTKEGPINKSDLITTSDIPGVGVKATKGGYVLGSALQEYKSDDPNKLGKIAVSMNLHYFNTKPTAVGTLTDIFKLALLPTKDGPSALFKYIAAAITAIAAFVLGFLSFGRTAAKGVEALGRNPMAGKIIHLGIIFNVIITVAIVLAGLIVAFLILRL